jgi:hypothetical protein
MPRTSIIAVAAVIVAVSIPASDAVRAAAGDRGGGGRAPTVAYGDDRGDPYAYRYQPPRYYPYYGSPYWRPAKEIPLYRDRYRHELPRYYPAWGYPQPLPAAPRRYSGE